MEIVGREPELRLVDSFLDAVAGGPRTLFLTGEAGIGKTTVWQAAIDRARERSPRVLVSRPTEAEARLPFAGLSDLFGDLVDEVRTDLPEPQRLALDVALMRATAHRTPPEPLAVSLAVLRLLRAAAEAGPLVMAIDDVPWLDSSSAGVIEFALRRLESEPVGLLAAQRTSSADVATPAVATAMGEGRVERHKVAPLSLDEVDRLLGSTLGLDLIRPTLTAVHRTSGGNPFFAVEIGRALQRRGVTSVRGSLPVPDSLAELVRDRIAALPPEAARVALYAAALSQPTEASLGSALGAEAVAAGLAALASAGIVHTEDVRVRFTHPLLAAEAYSREPEEGRREVHRALASLVAEPEEHARHLALSATGADAGVAAALEEAGEAAHARGAPDAAAELVEKAVALTPRGDTDGARRRTLAAAHYLVLAGDLPGARAVLEELLPRSARGARRAEVLSRLAEVLLLMDDWERADRLFHEALPSARGDVRQQIAIKLGLAGVAHVTFRNWEAGTRHAADAMRLAEDLDDPAVLAATIGHVATWEFCAGHGLRRDLMQRAAELEPWTVGMRAMQHPDYDFAGILARMGDRRAARALAERLIDRAERAGELASLGFLLLNIAWDDFTSGQPNHAIDGLSRAERVARTTGQATTLAAVQTARAQLAARLGPADRARVEAANALQLVRETGWARGEVWVTAELGQMELSLGNPAAAHALLESLIERGLPPFREPSFHREITPIDVEALVALGRLEEAKARLAPYERSGRRLNRLPVIADALRCRGLILGAQLEFEAAARALVEAREIYERVDDAWGKALTLRIAGDVHRRARQRAKATAALKAALAIFERLGATIWAERTRAELERIGTRRARDDALTAAQRQVAELAAAGRTNRQIAEALFMSAHTVEAHLSAIYRSLGLRSRTELGAALRDSAQGFRDSRRETARSF